MKVTKPHYNVFIILLLLMVALPAASQDNFLRVWSNGSKLLREGHYYEAMEKRDSLIYYFDQEVSLKNEEYGWLLQSIMYYFNEYGSSKKLIDFLNRQLVKHRTSGLGDTPDFYRVKRYLARSYSVLSMTKEATDEYNELLEDCRQSKNIGILEHAMALGWAGLYFLDLGQFAKAEKLINEAFILKKETCNNTDINGKEGTYWDGGYDMAYLYYKIKKLDKAKKYADYFLNYYYTDLGMKEDGDLFWQGPGAMLFQLDGNIVYEQGDYSQTLKFLKRAEKIYLSISKRNFYRLGFLYTDFGKCYNKLGDYETARNYFNKALDIQLSQQRGDKSIIFNIYIDIARFYHENNELDSAEKYYLLAIGKSEEIYQSPLFYFSEMEKINFWKNFSSLFDNFTGFCALRAKSHPAIIKKLLALRLKTKGLIYEINAGNNLNLSSETDTNIIKKYRKLNESRNLLSKYYNLSKEELLKVNFNLDSLSKEINKTERELSEACGIDTNRLKVPDYDEFASLTDPESAAVEIIRYKNSIKPGNPVSYGAIIVRNGMEPVFIEFPESEKFENEYYRLYAGCMMPGDSVTADYLKYKAYKKNLPENLHRLYNVFFQPIDEHLKYAKRIYLSCDGIYNKINPSTLCYRPGKYLVEKYDIRLLNNLKDLADGKGKKRHLIRSVALVGKPDYNADFLGNYKSKSTASANELKSDLRGFIYRSSVNKHWPELDETGKEVEEISDKLSSKNIEVEKLLGREADEKNVKEISGKDIIHIATHGYFDPNIPDSLAGMNEQFSNPLLRSGIILAGANSTIDAANNGDMNYFRKIDEDGILTSYEVARLNFTGTRLIILSACETGAGEIMNGEGVLGLQRAFRISGVKNVIMSLWKIKDKPTKIFMNKFYDKLMQGSDIHSAFRDSQLEMIKETQYSHPGIWGAFQLTGE